MGKYIKIKKEDIPEMFEVNRNKIHLKNSHSFSFKINFPLILDEEIAKIPAMIMDGSVSKYLKGFMFCQKKDKGKVKEFSNIIKKLFGVNGSFSIKKDSKTHIISYSRKALTYFIHHCLDIHKSDQSARIPKWVWKSPKSVIREYLRYAFAMEGSVEDYRKGNTIRFHSCDFSYLRELKSLLRLKYNINSKIQKYYIKDYGWKYYLYFQDAENITKFYNHIGFALDSHQERLRIMVDNFKSKAWEITLVKLLELNKTNFNISEANKFFSYLHKRAIHQRLSDLVSKGHIQIGKKGYSLTEKGRKLALSLKGKVKITKLRTNPIANEEEIINFLKYAGKGYRNEIARKLEINVSTVKDTLKRLIRRDLIRFIGGDKFQRKFYGIKHSSSYIYSY